MQRFSAVLNRHWKG